MQPFKSALQNVISRSKRAKGVALLFDFDGTLSEIVPHPDQATMISGWRPRLLRLCSQKNVLVGIITGRRIDDIRARAKTPGLIYAASHGYEIWKGRRKLMAIGAEHHKPLSKLAQMLEKEMKGIAGSQVEDKKTAVSIHYRRVEPKLRAIVIRRTKEIATPLLKKQGWQLTEGKMVLEIRPARQWNKGNAIMWIWRNLAPGFLPCYVGDDVTDEDGFRAIGKKGITIRVGRKKSSHAQYFVNNINDMIPWLDILETGKKS